MTGSPDRDRINLSEDYEIRDWTQSLGVREQEGAVKRVPRRLTIGTCIERRIEASSQWGRYSRRVPAMPKYYFHVCDGTQDIDELGHELPDDLAARREAVRYCCGLLRDDPDLLLADENLRINVTADDGRLRFAILLATIDADWRPGTPVEMQRLADTQR